jgi:CheY-like chemotaxis protein/glycopeptide antibiotics resistance protein
MAFAARPRRRALLVEDNENERNLLASFLRNRGVEVVTAGDGADALAYLSHHHEQPDVMLLDMGLPRCDGATVVRTVREDPAYSSLKIVVISGHLPQEYDLPQGPAGINCWFQKPIDPVTLLADLLPETASARPFAHAKLTAAHYHALLALAWAVIAVYLSLIPFSFQSRPLAQAWAHFCAAMVPHPITALPDFVANVLFFIPLGYFALGGHCANRGKAHGYLTVTWFALLLCACFSLAVEFAQVYFPPRAPDWNDVIAQFLGACIGAVTWHMLGRDLTQRCRSASETGCPAILAAPLLVGYVLVLVILQFLPFQFAVPSGWQFSDRLVTGLSRLTDGLPQDESHRYLWDLIYFLPAGVLAARIPRRAGHNRECGKEWQRALLFAFGTALLVNSADLFVPSRRFDGREVIFGALAFAIGWLVSRQCNRCRQTENASLSTSSVVAASIFFAGVGWLLATPRLLHGANVEYAGPGIALERIYALRWFPLSEVCGENPLIALRILVQKTLLFAPAGFLIGLLLPRTRRIYHGIMFTLLAAATAAFLELGPCVLTHADTTASAFVCETAGAWLGFALAMFCLVPHRQKSLEPSIRPTDVRSDRMQ